VHKDDQAPTVPTRGRPRRFGAYGSALVALTAALLALLAAVPQLAGADLSGEAARGGSGEEWIAGLRGSKGAAVLEAGTRSSPEATAEDPGSVEEGGEAPSAGALATSPQEAPIIGTNDGAGWGPAPARHIVAGDIRWNRVEIGTSTPNTLTSSLRYGFKVLAIVGNTGDSTPISSIEPHEWGAEVASQLRGKRGITLAEAGNEMYLKGNTADPVQYGRMYMAAIEALKASTIRTPLLFDMTGDYPTGGGWSAPRGWSTDAQGGGWLRSAVAAVPGLARAILANGIAIHPYGAVGENTHDDWGTAAAAADEAVARAVLGRVPPFYITEFGYNLARCGANTGACSLRAQAHQMRAAYNAFLADPNVAGIWWYQSHDDDTGQWGFMNNDNTVRPSFRTLSAIARLVGQ
jgi:hypothetical protein